MSIIFDLQEGTRGQLTSESGLTIERVCVVTNVTGGTVDKIVKALREPGIPRIGSSHPSISTCRLHEIVPEVMDIDKVKLRLLYKQSSGAGDYSEDIYDASESQIEVGATVSQVETNKDYKGNTMFVGYKYPTDYNSDTGRANDIQVDSGLVTKLHPESTLNLTRRESFSPQTIAFDYVGKVNGVAWQGGAKRTWLCTGIVGRSADSGYTYNVTYTFQRRFDDRRNKTWDAEILWIDPYTGKPPVLKTSEIDLSEASELDDVLKNYQDDNGVFIKIPAALRSYQIYETADFDELGLFTNVNDGGS